MAAINNLDDVVKALKTLDDKITRHIGFFERLEKVPLSQKFTQVGDVSEEITSSFLPYLGTEKIKEWNTRAIKIETVNRILRDMEVSTVRAVTNSSASVALKEIWSLIYLTTIIARNLEPIRLVAGEVAKLFGEVSTALVDEDGRAVWTLVAFLLSSEFRQRFYDRVEARKNEFLIAMLIVVSLFTIKTAQAALASFSLANFKKSLEPLIALKASSEAALMAGAFPQGKGRVRRERIQRLRKKR